jgi:hypothetical protein
LENLLCRKYYFKELTLFSQGNNGLDAAASNTYGLLCSDTCVFDVSLISVFGRNSLSTPLKTIIVGGFPFKNEFNSHRDTMCYIILLLRCIVFF